VGLFARICELSTKRLEYRNGPTPDEWSRFTPEEKNIFFKQEAAYNRILLDTHEAEIEERYRSLTHEQAREIIFEACAYYDGVVDTAHTYIVEITLQKIAIYQPDALIGLHDLLFDRHLAWTDGLIYRNADTVTRDRMVALVQDAEKLSAWHEEVLRGLAWIDDKSVQDKFLQWGTSPLAWTWESGYSPVGRFDWYAGWEFDRIGQRRQLCFAPTFALMKPSSDVELSNSSVSVGGPAPGNCPWCGRNFTCILDIQSPMLQSLTAKEGQRLRIIACLNCSLQEPTFFDIDLQGNAVWSVSNGNQPSDLYLYPDEHVMNISAKSLVLGKPHQPYLHIGAYWSHGLSQLGGYPEWVQYPEYPTCPTCHQTMIFISQISPRDITGDEGLIYAFVCFECGKTTLGFQST